MTAVAQPHLFAPDTLVSLDTASQFYPWYTFLGESLRAGHIPGWNPAVFSGTPFAANPLSGWTYLPAMLLFTVLPLASAARIYLVFHALLAAFGTFGLARVLGIGRVGALLAGVAYANTSFFQVQNACCFAFASVYAWLPVAILGVELAVLSTTWYVRAAWWSLGALAVSQILAAWLGQGAYYALVVLGGYIVYRTVFVVPACSAGHVVRRIGRLVIHATGVLVFGAILDAAGLLPRLEFNALSNLAGGYSGREASVGGLHPKDWLLLIVPGFWYAGISVMVLAVVALVSRRGWLNRPLLVYFGATSLCALLLTGTVQTPLHWLLYHVLPGFARLHPHAPERILTVAYLGPALLAGAGATALRERIAAGGALRGRPWARQLASSVLVLIVGVDLALAGAKARSDWALSDPLNGADKLTPVDLSTYYRTDAAAAFLRAQLNEFPARYVGYAPDFRGEPWPYSTRIFDPRTAALAVGNRALPLGLRDVQGYDASHLERYDAYLAALNGRIQNYHDAEIFPAGLNSPLFDLLNVRYIVIPRQPPLEAADAAVLGRFLPQVYADARVQILENPRAFPRAWIVHSVTQATRDDALAAIASGDVNARESAFVEETPPRLQPSTDPASDRASITHDLPDRIAGTTYSDAPGLLVLSEIAYPAWHAYIDGRPVPVYTADGALRAVAVPSGEHAIELRFESISLQVGSVISCLAVGLLAVLALLPALAARWPALLPAVAARWPALVSRRRRRWQFPMRVPSRGA